MAALDIYFHALEDAMDATGLLGLAEHMSDAAFFGLLLAASLMLGLVLGPSRLGMPLMPISSALCWSLLAYWPIYYQPFGFLLPCAGFYWCWAWKNRLCGPIRIDGGVITFLPGVVAGGLAMLPTAPIHPTMWRGAFYIAVTLLPAANFLVPVVYFVRSRPSFAQVSARYGKPSPFGTVFFFYCFSQFLFFPAAAIHFGHGSRLDWAAALLGVLLFVVLAIVAKAAAGVINAPILAREKRERQAAKAQAKSAA